MDATEKGAALIDIEKTVNHLKRYNLRYFRHKAYDLSIRRRIVSRIDRRRLEREYPGLRSHYENSKEDLRQQILPHYRQYITEVSSEIMASSLELSVFLLFLCRLLEPRSILDLGSGFSSFLFRFHGQTVAEKPLICSVDDSGEWLIKTENFLKAHRLPAENLMMWDDFIGSGRGPFDLIFYDLGPFEFRKDSLGTVLEKMTGPTGVVVLDDMHSADYGLFVKGLLKGTRFRSYDTGCYTRDHYSRYSLLLAY